MERYRNSQSERTLRNSWPTAPVYPDDCDGGAILAEGHTDGGGGGAIAEEGDGGP